MQSLDGVKPLIDYMKLGAYKLLVASQESIMTSKLGSPDVNSFQTCNFVSCSSPPDPASDNPDHFCSEVNMG